MEVFNIGDIHIESNPPPQKQTSLASMKLNSMNQNIWANSSS